MIALIHQPALNAMQSGNNGHDIWVIEFPAGMRGTVDPLTGTSSSSDMQKEVKLRFETKELAIAYAKTNGIAYQVRQRSTHTPKGRSYADNFAFERKFPWTH